MGFSNLDISVVACLIYSLILEFDYRKYLEYLRALNMLCRISHNILSALFLCSSFSTPSATTVNPSLCGIEIISTVSKYFSFNVDH